MSAKTKKIEELTAKTSQLVTGDLLILADSEDTDVDGDLITKNISPDLLRPAIDDEGTSVETAMKSMDFVGADIEVRSLPNGRVVVYCPPPVFSPVFNGGSDVSTTSRYISEPTTEGVPFSRGNFTNGNMYASTRSSSISYADNSFTCENGATTLTATIYGANGATVLGTNQVVIDGNKNDSQENITISISGYGAEEYKFVANATISFDLDSILPDSGRFSIRLVHNNNGTEHVKTQNNIFYDSEPETIDGSDVEIVENTPVLKYCSGVIGYNVGSTFDITIGDIDYINSDTYPSTIVTLSIGDYYLSGDTSITTGELTGWTYAHGQIDVTYGSTYTMNQNNLYLKTSTANVSANFYDWSLVDTEVSPDSPIIINSLTSSTSRVTENLTCETNRLESDLSTAWNSVTHLGSIDNGDGLQVENGHLIYPTEDFTTFNPSPGSQPDYSSVTGNKTYYRHFWYDNNYRSNVYFNISGIVNSQLEEVGSGDINIEITLNGTDWYDCGKEYTSGPIVAGDGCRINVDTTSLPVLQLTFGEGGQTTPGSNWGVYLRITYRVDTVNISQIRVTNWG